MWLGQSVILGHNFGKIPWHVSISHHDACSKLSAGEEERGKKKRESSFETTKPISIIFKASQNASPPVGAIPLPCCHCTQCTALLQKPAQWEPSIGHHLIPYCGRFMATSFSGAPQDPPFLQSCWTTRNRLLLINLQRRQRDRRSAKGSGIVLATFNVRWLSAAGMTDNRCIIFTEEQCPTPAIKPPILIQMTSLWLLWRGRASVQSSSAITVANTAVERGGIRPLKNYCLSLHCVAVWAD